MKPPPTLLTATPADGQRLARCLADELLSALPPAPSTMPEMLRTGSSARPEPAVVAAIYFHAISLANAGWPAPTTPGIGVPLIQTP